MKAKKTQPLQSNGQDLVSFWCLWGKTNGLSTIVWFSIHVWPKLPPRVRCLGRKILPCRHFGERQSLDFGLECEGSRGQIIGFLRFDRWKSTASWPSAIVWSGLSVMFKSWQVEQNFNKLTFIRLLNWSSLGYGRGTYSWSWPIGNL
jgi:hypothetical protein